MHRKVSIKAPAKVNLHLDILEKRPDGFHNLISLFQSVSLYDTLSIRSLKTQGEYELQGNFSFPASENIISQAVELFRRHTGLTTGLKVEVQKEIPLGSGLGGGSSDAAATLTGLNLLLEGGLTPRELTELGAQLGSDVPFFLGSPSAIVTGRGETVTPLSPRKDFNLLLICPEFEVNTAQAYRWLEEDRKKQGKDKQKITTKQLESLYLNPEAPVWHMDNSFRQVLCRRFSEYAEIFRTLKDSGACYINISGSGSAIYGVFTRKKEVEQAFNCFTCKYSFIRIVNPLDKRPTFILD